MNFNSGIPDSDAFLEIPVETVLFGVVEQWAGTSNTALICVLEKYSYSEGHTLLYNVEKTIYSCCATRIASHPQVRRQFHTYSVTGNA